MPKITINIDGGATGACCKTGSTAGCVDDSCHVSINPRICGKYGKLAHIHCSKQVM